MYELPEQAIAMLRERGFSDAQIAELEANGTLAQGAGTAESVTVRVTGTSNVSVNGMAISPGNIPPEAIENLKRFHALIPKDALHQLEDMTGEDIDGDGMIGSGTASASLAARAGSSAEASMHEAARSTSSSPGPFVGGSTPGRGTGTVLLGALVGVGVIAAVAVLLLR